MNGQRAHHQAAPHQPELGDFTSQSDLRKISNFYSNSDHGDIDCKEEGLIDDDFFDLDSQWSVVRESHINRKKPQGGFQV